MRALAFLLIWLVAPAVVAQQPPQRPPIYPDRPLSPDEIEAIRNPPAEPSPDQKACEAQLEAVRMEAATSKAALKLKTLAEIPLKDQYEQEMYFYDRAIKAREGKACRAAGLSPFGEEELKTDKSNLAIRRRACGIVAPDCKAVKHW